jgi:glycosyltransferase involved in cell wall biosynthesis
MPKVTVIIPVYNVESFIEKCSCSLFDQTLDDVEYIFVNDATPDRSMEILNDVIARYPNRRGQIRILNHERNLGLPDARKSGIMAATGEYIIHCDSDDWVEPEMYEKMYDKAVAESADVVIAGFKRETPQGPVTVSVGNLPADVHVMFQELYRNKIPFYPCVWNKLFKRSIYVDNNILPYEGLALGEDVNLTFRLLFYARRLAVVDEPLYHYNCCNESAMSFNLHSYVTNWKSLKEILDKTVDFIDREGKGQFHLTARMLQFTHKHYLFNVRTYKLWRKTYPESHRHIFKFVKYPLYSRVIYSLVARSGTFAYLFFNTVHRY